jgi:hypothetical protein
MMLLEEDGELIGPGMSQGVCTKAGLLEQAWKELKKRVSVEPKGPRSKWTMQKCKAFKISPSGSVLE